MSYIDSVNAGGTTYKIQETMYITPSLSGTAYTASLTNFTLATGATVQAKFANTNPANATLNVNSTGAKNIFYNGAKITANQFKVDHTYTLVYDGTQWQVVGDIDTNTNTWRGIQDNLTSDSTTDSLSAKQGKVLKGLIDAMDASTPAADGNATAFIDSITQTDGKITSITKKNIPTASTSTAGIIKIGTAATNAMAGNTVVNKVKQNNNTENKEFSILLKTSNNTTDETGEVKFVKNYDVTVNPSTGRLSATSFMVDSHVTLQWNSTDSSLDFIFA